MKWILDQFFGAQLAKKTSQYLDDLKTAPKRASQEKVTRLLESLAEEPGAKIAVGETLEGRQKAYLPEAEFFHHATLTGATGGGKTMGAASLLRQIISRMPSGNRHGLTVLDGGKRDLYLITLCLLSEHLHLLARQDQRAYEELLDRIRIIDFASRDPVSEYNILAPWPGADLEYFAATRSEQLLDQLEGADRLSLQGGSFLQKVIHLLAASKLPITKFGEVLDDQSLRNRLVAACPSVLVRTYFERRYATLPKQIVEAVRRRIESLFRVESLRLALSGRSAPDFRCYQDEGKIVGVNFFGEDISRSDRQFFQRLVFSDIRQSVFARQHPECRHLFIID